jgi:5'-nucleotidase
MQALITNDDGIDSTGLRVLTQIAVTAGLEVTVAAPHTEHSGSSAALSALEADGRLLIEDRVLDGLPGVRAVAAHASPALIVFLAAYGAFGPRPGLVLSGINHGPNTGQAVLHSGTVGAALTARTHGIPALAVSVASAQPTHWDTAATAASQALRWFLRRTGKPIVANVNVPDLPADKLRGLRVAQLAAFGVIQATIGEPGRGFIPVTFSEPGQQPEPGTDLALLRQGWATVTALLGPCEDAPRPRPAWVNRRPPEPPTGPAPRLPASSRIRHGA